MTEHPILRPARIEKAKEQKSVEPHSILMPPKNGPQKPMISWSSVAAVFRAVE